MISRDMDRGGNGNNTHRFFRLLNTSFNLLEGILDLVVDDVDLMFPNDRDRGLGGELFWARPPHTPVPSHANFWGAKRATTMGEGG